MSRHCGANPIDKRENQQWLDLYDPTCVRDMLNESCEIRHFGVNWPNGGSYMFELVVLTTGSSKSRVYPRAIGRPLPVVAELCYRLISVYRSGT